MVSGSQHQMDVQVQAPRALKAPREAGGRSERAASRTCQTPPHRAPLQNKLFGSLVGSAACTVQLELRPSGAAAAAAGGVQPTVTLKNRRDELETLPLFSSKDTISGEVGAGPKPLFPTPSFLPRVCLR